MQSYESYTTVIFSLYQALLVTYGRQAWWPGDSPFEVMVGAILTQNTSWSNVEKALIRLKQTIVLEPRRILSLTRDELEQCLKPAGFFRIKTQRLQFYCHWYLSHGGYYGVQKFSTVKLRKLLLNVHGIGQETADDILLYALDRPVFVIDTYTRRLLQRLKLIKGDEKYEVLRLLFENNLPKRVDIYKQFHALIIAHAKHRCRKTKPICKDCNLTEKCFYIRQIKY